MVGVAAVAERVQAEAAAAGEEVVTLIPYLNSIRQALVLRLLSWEVFP
jgi:hypothetical protein